MFAIVIFDIFVNFIFMFVVIIRKYIVIYPGPSNSFAWPKRKDVCWVPYMHVICKIRPPTTSTGQTLSREGR